MNPVQILGLQIAMSFLLYTMIARWYLAPKLAAMPWPEALVPLLFFHAMRYVGMVFLLPQVTRNVLPTGFSLPAAYGDLLTSVLAFVTLFAIRARSGAAIPLAWITNVVGTVDLLNAYYQGISRQPDLGAAYYIPPFIVPALLVTHAMMFIMLVTRRPTPAR